MFKLSMSPNYVVVAPTQSIFSLNTQIRTEHNLYLKKIFWKVFESYQGTICTKQHDIRPESSTKYIELQKQNKLILRLCLLRICLLSEKIDWVGATTT